MKNWTLPLLILFALSCNDVPVKSWPLSESEDDTASSAPISVTAEGQPSAEDPQARNEGEPFVVHEWGTYTSLQGSNGEILPGMHYEEESLPAFVHGRVPPPPPGMPASKNVEDLLLDGITQKLETPVIYFYGAPSAVEVTVDFPHGVISQWYPNATSMAPEVYGAEFSADDILDGRMTWSLDLLEVGKTEGIIDVPSDDVWAPSRNVDAQPVRFGDEVEKFIFYRGLGRFEMPFKVTSEQEELQIHNESDDRVPDVWVLHWDGERGEVWSLGALDGRSSRVFIPTPKELPQPDYLERARTMVAEGLVASGLTSDEAWAMVDTWERSYFRATGWRVLYVAPRAWTDELLPLQVSPKPDELVRTLIGRVEVMTDTEERDLLATLRAGEWNPSNYGRFAEARLQRALQLASDEALETEILTLIAQTRSGTR